MANLGGLTQHMQASHSEARHFQCLPTPGLADRGETLHDEGLQEIDDFACGGSAGSAGLGLAHTVFHPLIDGQGFSSFTTNLFS